MGAEGGRRAHRGKTRRTGGIRRILLARPRLWAGLVLVALVAGHWLYHYRPRFRPEAPEGAAAALLDQRWAEVAVWVPYPHQNLPMLEAHAGLVPASGGDVLTLADVETPRLPSFGGMLSPPARSLALASGEYGELAVAVEIYPTFAAFARLAGLLAKNPWLAGGELDWQGRKIEVAWRDGLWLAGSPRLPDLGVASAPDRAEPALLVADASNPADPLPAGRYRLRLEGEDFVVRSEAAEVVADAPADTLDGAALDRAGALLLLVAEGARARQEAHAMALFALPGSAITELPRAASLHRGAERFELPAESLLELAGHELERGERSGYSLIATDRVAYEGASLLAPSLEARLGARPRELDLWLRLGPAAVEVGRMCRGFEQAPFLSKRRLRSWQSAERLLRGLAGKHSTLRLEVWQDASARRALRLQIERREEGSSAD